MVNTLLTDAFSLFVAVAIVVFVVNTADMISVLTGVDKNAFSEMVNEFGILQEACSNSIYKVIRFSVASIYLGYFIGLVHTNSIYGYIMFSTKFY